MIDDQTLATRIAETINPGAISWRSNNERTTNERPWVMANMVMSADGAYSVQGRSGGLSGQADKAVFNTLRGLADAILVGASTAREERYRRPSADDTTRAQRSARGQPERPVLAVVSGSGVFPVDQPFREGEGPEPIVFTSNGAAADAELLSHGLRFRLTGTDVNEPFRIGPVIQNLSAEGCRTILCEGGPHLLGQLVEEQMLDQLFLTLAPRLAGGETTGLLGRGATGSAELSLRGALEADGFLMLNYHVLY